MKKISSGKLLVALDLLLAFGAAGYWHTAGEPHMVAVAVFLSVLIAAFPLPRFVSVPWLSHVAAQKAASFGIKFHSRRAVANMAQVDTLVLSKNGIITEGLPFITDIVPEGFNQSTLLGLAASAEAESSHPIAKVIYRTALNRGIRLQRVSAMSEVPGCGVEALINGAPLRVGKRKWLEAEGVEISANLLTRGDQLSTKGRVPVFVGAGKICRGIIALHYELKKQNIAAISRLQKLGLVIIMLTGDNKRTTSAIVKATGVDDARAEVLPSGKAREIQLMQARGAVVAMAGDAQADAAALAKADVSIDIGTAENEAVAEDGGSKAETLAELEARLAGDGMGTAAEAAPDGTGDGQKAGAPPEAGPAPRRSANIVLTSGSIWDLINVFRLCRQAMLIDKQNRRISLLAYALLLPPAMGLLHILGGPWMNPLFSLGGLIVICLIVLANSRRLNSLELKTYRPLLSDKR